MKVVCFAVVAPGLEPAQEWGQLEGWVRSMNQDGDTGIWCAPAGNNQYTVQVPILLVHEFVMLIAVLYQHGDWQTGWWGVTGNW